MANNIGDIAATATLNIEPFQQNTRQLKTYLRGVDKSLQALETSLKGSGKNLGTMKTLYGQTGSALKDYQKLLTQQKDKYEKLITTTGDLSKATSQQKQDIAGAKAAMADTEAKVASLTNKYQALAKEIAIQESGFTKFGNKAVSLGNHLQTAGGHVESLGKKVSLVSAPLALGLTKATQSALTFNDEIQGMGALLDNGTLSAEQLQNQLVGISEASKKFSQEYGIATSSINNGMEELIKKGYTYNQTLGAMPAILDATKASGDEFNDVMDASTSILQQFGLNVDDTAGILRNTTRVTDSLTFVANETAAGFKDMADAMEYVGPVANSLNMSLEETSAAIGIMSDSGIKGQKAGTALRGALTKLLKPSKQNIEGFEQLGISVEEFKNGSIGLPDILDKIKVNTEGWTDQQKAAAIALAFGTEAQTGMNVLINEGGDALRNLTRETENAQGYTKKLAETMNNTAKAKVDKFKASLGVLGITLGSEVIPTLIPFVEKATEMVKKFSELDDATKQNIVKWGLLGAAAGPALLILGKGIGTVGSVAKGIGNLSKWLGTMSGTAKAAGAATELLEGGLTVAETGVTGFTTGLKLLNPWVLGITAAVGLGYGAWKLWGEEAWNSAQRTKRWGTDVGEVTDKALTDVQGYSQGAIGEFGLIEQGLSGNVDSMIGNFQKMGKSIESDLTRQIEGFREAIKMLPEEVQAEGQEIINNANKTRLEALKIAEENNEEIADIRNRASKQNRDITLNEAKMIKDLMTQSATEYLNITIQDAEARKEVLSAMTGDVESASAEQAKAWLQSLGKQRQETKTAYSKQLDDFKKHLKEQGTLNTQEGQQLVELFEKSRDASTDAIDEQMALITAKYPELLDKVSLANGQLASTMGEAGDHVREANKNLLADVDTMSEKIKVSADKNAKELGMMGDGATRAGKRWNSIVLDEKTGEIKTNAVEEVVKATESVGDWNELAFTAHEAKLESNAKLVIAEAALANGHWGSLEFMGKEALIESNATRTMIEVMQEQGIWEGMSFEEKKAILYSDTPEKVAEAAFNMGLWDKLSPSVKELEAENYKFLNKLSESKTAIEEYNSISPELKTLLADGPAKMTIDETKTALEQYEGLSPEMKTLLALNEDAVSKVQEAEDKVGAYNALPTPPKLLKGDNKDVVKSADLGQRALTAYNNNNPLLKKLQANNADVVNKSAQGTQSIKTYDGTNAGRKYLKATDNASGPAKTATDAVKGFSQQKDKTVTLTTVVKTITEKITKVFKHAKGTNYHPGGLAMVNDQKGGMFKEYVELPSGHGFIPQSRDVLLDLPRGSKVLKASLTKQIFPQYAQGVAFENTGIAALASQLRTVQQDGQLTIQTDYSDEKMNRIISLLEVIVKSMSADGTEDVLVKMLNELKQSNRTNSQYDKRSIINEIEKTLARRF